LQIVVAKHHLGRHPAIQALSQRPREHAELHDVHPAVDVPAELQRFLVEVLTAAVQ